MDDILDLLTPSEAARLLDVTPERVRQLADAGRLASTRTRLGRLFALADVEAFKVTRQGSQNGKRWTA